MVAMDDGVGLWHADEVLVTTAAVPVSAFIASERPGHADGPAAGSVHAALDTGVVLAGTASTPGAAAPGPTSPVGSGSLGIHRGVRAVVTRVHPEAPTQEEFVGHAGAVLTAAVERARAD